jgi:hypothetical protein
MSEPVRITCRSAADVPPVAEIEKMVSEDQYLLLEFPVDSAVDTATLDALLHQLTGAMPDHRVFDGRMMSGDYRITVKKVISTREVLKNAKDIVSAARQFRTQANRLTDGLAQHLCLPLEAFRDPLVRMQIHWEGPELGFLPNGWRFWFHGMECQFVHEDTGQTVEVKLGFYPEFGVLDPWFFKEFLETTPELASVAALCNDYHNTTQAFEVLEQHGYLERLTSQTAPRTGLVARDG